jgi:4-amino-4-deoxy-L-arabinose transferase-like glycosyltransferase
VLGRLRTPAGGFRLDGLVLTGLLVLAAVLRFTDLRTRGTWDGDQGHDMLVLRSLVVDGVLPLLGPPTSIGEFHHGALYYYLLAPAAALTGADPFWVVVEIALAGIAAVAVTWWLARSIGGSVAGAVAGLLMAVSASAIAESTFIWNPNLIALSSAIALAGAWRAWSTGMARWWILAAVGVIVTMHCHVLGAVLLPPIAGVALLDAKRRGPGPERRRVLVALLGGGALLAASYVPLLVHELEFNGSELRAALDFIAGGGSSSDTALPARVVIVALRVLAWPLAGLITEAPVAALLAAILVAAAIAGLWRASRPAERLAARWFGLSLAWIVVALTFAASSLATVIPGLPNDHYHAFADPMIFIVIGLGAGALARWRPNGQPVGIVAAATACAVAVAFNASIWPPAVAPDGGWPAGEAAADRILDSVGLGSVPDPLPVLHGLPTFKSADAVRFPLVRRGMATWDQTATSEGWSHVVLCDELFRDAIGADCGGPAEDALVAEFGVGLADRFEAAPGRWISVYLQGPPSD